MLVPRKPALKIRRVPWLDLVLPMIFRQSERVCRSYSGSATALRLTTISGVRMGRSPMLLMADPEQRINQEYHLSCAEVCSVDGQPK
jgi:hypothetical protein